MGVGRICKEDEMESSRSWTKLEVDESLKKMKFE